MSDNASRKASAAPPAYADAVGMTAAEGPVIDTAPGGAALLPELANLLVEALNLEVSATEIDPAAPLYGDGLGLDSIDILELALVVSKRYGVQLRADNSDNLKIFASLSALAGYIAAHRSK